MPPNSPMTEQELRGEVLRAFGGPTKVGPLGRLPPVWRYPVTRTPSSGRLVTISIDAGGVRLGGAS